jgi:hypothetical protein
MLVLRTELGHDNVRAGEVWETAFDEDSLFGGGATVVLDFKLELLALALGVYPVPDRSEKFYWIKVTFSSESGEECFGLFDGGEYRDLGLDGELRLRAGIRGAFFEHGGTNLDRFRFVVSPLHHD